MLTQGDRLRTYREYLGLTQIQLAERLHFTQGFITKAEKKTENIPSSIISALIEMNKFTESRLNFDWLLTGKGEMFLTNDLDNIGMMGDAMGKPNIMVVPFAANAGAGIESQLIEIVTKGYLPMLKEMAYAFNVKGNSMSPIFENKDWIIAYQLHDESTMRPGAPYVLRLTNGEYVIKYIDKRGAKWILRSENYREYANREINREEVECIYEIKLRLTEYWGWGE